MSADQPAPSTTTPASGAPRGMHDLLRLQEIDTGTDRLHARRSQLEGGAEVAAAREVFAAAEWKVTELRLAIEALARDQLRLESDVDSMNRKRRDEEKRLYDGSVANPKELQSLRAEVESIANRKRRTEDRQLELMEEREALDARLAPAEEEASAARVALDELTKDSSQELTQIERTLAELTTARAAIVPGIDEELLDLYESVRRQKKGVGVAELRDGICNGCHQKLSPMELDRIRRTEVWRCEYCRRILVVP